MMAATSWYGLALDQKQTIFQHKREFILFQSGLLLK